MTLRERVASLEEFRGWLVWIQGQWELCHDVDKGGDNKFDYWSYDCGVSTGCQIGPDGVLDKLAELCPPLPPADEGGTEPVTLEDILDVLEDMVGQFCRCRASATNDMCRDSLGFGCSAEAMRLLARAGRLEITTDVGARVIGRVRQKAK